jgi:hypothetical protein
MVMEHDEALERIEIAAAEPEGIERLMAGDTAEAAAVAGHLAGCASCTAELARIRRVAVVARDAVRTQPDPELRQRTLGFVRAVGVPRGASPASASPEPVEVAALSAAPASLDDARRRRETRGLRAAVAVLAAALVIAVGAGVVGYRSLSADMTALQDEHAQQIAVLDATTRTTLAVTAQPDARRVPLTATSGGDAAGTLLFSASTGELVAVASDLVPEAAGQEYGCWIEVDGTRTRIGKMYWAGDLWAWAGPVPGLADVPAGTLFGVSLGPVDGGSGSAPVLTGEL